MKLLTKELMEKIPASQDGAGENAVVHTKFFTPDSSWTWYVTEAVAVLETGEEVSLRQLDDQPYVDIRFFGLVDGFEKELGYFSYNEMSSTKGPMGLYIERDLHWKPMTIGQVRSKPPSQMTRVNVDSR